MKKIILLLHFLAFTENVYRRLVCIYLIYLNKIIQKQRTSRDVKPHVFADLFVN